MHQDIFGGRSTHSWKDERNREESGSRRGGRDQLPDADIQTERQSVGLFRGVQESHRILSDTLRCRSLQEELSRYKKGKGSVQFPMDQPIPYDLMRRIVLFR